jgi:N-acetylglucosaminyl-diphospho-decaprenol L-rhamnosyltransferase
VVAPLVSVIVPSLNGAHLLPDCLDSLTRQSYPNLEVIVADGASSDPTADLLAREYANVRLLRLQRNRGFAGNVNAGLRAAHGEIVCLLNNDA